MASSTGVANAETGTSTPSSSTSADSSADRSSSSKAPAGKESARKTPKSVEAKRYASSSSRKTDYKSKGRAETRSSDQDEAEPSVAGNATGTNLPSESEETTDSIAPNQLEMSTVATVSSRDEKGAGLELESADPEIEDRSVIYDTPQVDPDLNDVDSVSTGSSTLADSFATNAEFATNDAAESVVTKASGIPSISDAITDTIKTPEHGSSLAVSADGTKIYVPRANAVDIYDTSSHVKLQTIEIAKFNARYEAAVSSDGTRLFLAGDVSVEGTVRRSGAIAIVDLRDGTSRIVVPMEDDAAIPASIAVSGDGKTLYATATGPDFPYVGHIFKIDVMTGAVLSSAAVGRVFPFRWDIALSPDGRRIYASGQTVIDDNGSLATRHVVRSIDTTDLSVVDEVATSGRSDEAYLAVSSDGKRIYALSLQQFEGGKLDYVVSIIRVAGDDLTLTASRVLEVGDSFSSLAGVSVSPDDRRLFLLAESENEQRTADLVILDAFDGRVLYRGVLKIGDLSLARGQIVFSEEGRYLHVRVQTHSEADGTVNQVITFDTTKLTAGGSDGGGRTDPIEELLAAVSFSNEVTKWLDKLSKVWNWGAVFKGYQFIDGVKKFAEGIRDLNIAKAVQGGAEIVSTLLTGPPAVILELGKLIISIVLPLSAEESAKFFEFRARCMFNKDSEDLTITEAKEMVGRYTGAASIITIPADYARYNVGGWFGSPSC